MDDKFRDNLDRENENIAQKLKQVAEQIDVNPQFVRELEQGLREAQRPKSGWLAYSFGQISPTLRWVALMILLGLVLSWSIKTLIPTPQPSINNTPVITDTATPTPDAVLSQTQTPVTGNTGYDWRGTKLYLAAPLPELPTEANVYLLKPDQHATIEEARALAQQFGIDGEIYLAPNQIPGSTDYFFTDGKQSLSVSSDQFFTYTADMAKAYSYFNTITIPDPNAEGTIEDFLQSHGFDFPHTIKPAELFDGYSVEPLSPEGFPMRYEYFSSRPLHVTLDEDGQVLRVEADLMSYDRYGRQTYGILSAEEAFQKILDDNTPAGKIESLHSSSQPLQEWRRVHSTNETITIYGYVSSIPALDSSKPPFIRIDGYTATGDTTGIELLGQNTFIEASGQFVTENGIENFRIESWRVSELSEEGFMGTLQYNGAQVVLSTAEEGEYILPEVPPDVPIPFENAFVVGVRIGDLFEWKLIDNRNSAGGGGGGGGGLGFYKLNLSGTPVPFPTPTSQPGTNQGNVEYIVKEGDTLLAIATAYGITPEQILQANSWLSEEHAVIPGKTLIIPIPQSGSKPGQYTVKEGDTLIMIAQNFGITVDELMQANGLNDPMIFVGQKLIIPGAQSPSQNPLIGKRFEDQRGIFVVNIYRESDGSQRKAYTFMTSQENTSYYLILEGDNLQELEKYHNRPVDIWATIEKVDQFGTLTVKVDRFEVPFPDLQIQILRGQQKTEIVAGQLIQLFTTEDGRTYVELIINGNVNVAVIGAEGDDVLHEALIIPDETYAGYPTIRIFSSGMAVSPKSGEAVEMTVTADKPLIMDEMPDSGQSTSPPATIERVDLIYYVTNQHWQVEHLDGGPQYIQPVWRFYGHYNNGDEFEILVQALKQEYLLPELAPYIQGG